ncbi:S-adenosyl-L-methionine-dependent methyltransferase [Nemania sp. NC0429]|nr:S-adenosyl-L-methionine-dependent methyltransferase [Nemania sp. NC0429]
MMAVLHIVGLATRITANTCKVGDYLAANNMPQPSFGIDAPLYGAVPESAPEMAALRRSIIEDTTELRDLLLGPRDYLFSFVHNALLPQQATTRFNLARNLPVGGEQTFAEMAAQAGLPEPKVKRLVRFAVTQRIFKEPRPGVVTHSAASRLLAEDPFVHDFVATCTDELWQAAAQTCNALTRHPGSEEPGETGFTVANHTDKPIHTFLEENPPRSIRFANMMRAFTTGSAFDLKYVTDFYPWELHEGGTVVDVGGSRGCVCVELARKFPTLKFIVQGLEPVIEDARSHVPPDVAGRVAMEVHDFFLPQPVVGADVYFFRWIFHNWSDKYTVKILQSLVPALKPGAKIIINDAVLLEPGKMPRPLEARVRSFDVVMGTIQNAKERVLDEWIDLFRRADERFVFEGATSPPGSQLSILVATWRGT